MRSPDRLLPIALTAAIAIHASGLVSLGHGQDNHPKSISEWIDDLESESYVTRHRATEHLLRHVVLGSPNQTEVIEALRSCLFGSEKKTDSRQHVQELLLRIVDQPAFDQLTRLTKPDCSGEDISLPGWRSFASMAGNSWDSRQLFRQIYLRNGALLKSHFGDSPEMATGIDHRLTRLNRTDEVTWATLLLLSQARQSCRLNRLSWEMISVLSQPGYGPDETSVHPVVRQLISHWLQSRPDVGLVSDHILAATRYRCDSQVISLCDEVLSDPSLPAPTHATAFLALAAIESTTYLPLGASSRASDLLSESMSGLKSDQRICHRFCTQFNLARIETRVQDVALAVDLHRNGIDPRSIGFKRLQADPWTLFRADSLGFENQAAREQAYDRALRLMQGH